MRRRGPVPGWLVATAAVAIGANLLASYTTGLTVEFMGGVSAFARDSRRHELAFLPWYRLVAYGVLVPCIIGYMWPITRWAPARGEPVPGWLQRRVVSAPLLVAALGFAGWVGSIFVFPVTTLLRAGRWSPDLIDPEHRAAGAAAALRCADGMRAELVRLNVTRAGTARAPLALKIGVHTGPVVAGTIGAADRHEYTVIGDTVNVAARLEQLCRQHGRDLLVSETTHRLAAAGGEPRAVVMQAAVALRGRDEPVPVVALG